MVLPLYLISVSEVDIDMIPIFQRKKLWLREKKLKQLIQDMQIVTVKGRV